MVDAADLKSVSLYREWGFESLPGHHLCTAMNDVQAKLMELKDRAWTMAAIADELGVSHMAVFRWQKGMRKADNSRSVLHMLDTLMKRKRIPKQRRRGSSSSLKNASTVNRKSD